MTCGIKATMGHDEESSSLIAASEGLSVEMMYARKEDIKERKLVGYTTGVDSVLEQWSI